MMMCDMYKDLKQLALCFILLVVASINTIANTQEFGVMANIIYTCFKMLVRFFIFMSTVCLVKM